MGGVAGPFEPDLSVERCHGVAHDGYLWFLQLFLATGRLPGCLGETLGEVRFGSDHWDLGFLINSYYLLKPILPRSLTRHLRQLYYPPARHTQQIPWPVDAMELTGKVVLTVA